jgi:hypothetical protein
MGEKRRIIRVTQGTAKDAATGARAIMGKGITKAKGMGGAVGDVASAVPGLMTSIVGPTVPLLEPWSIGLGQVISGHPKLSPKLRGITLGLDRLGHLEISPEAISFDGEGVPWDEIDEIKFGPAVDVITSHALQNEIGRLTARLPQMPGRDWLVRQAIEVLVALCLAAAGTAEAEHPDGHGDNPTDDHTPLGVPVAVMYGGPVRRKALPPGVFVALIAASVPSVSEAIASLARERGIKVTAAPPSRSHKQAIVMRKLAGSLSSRISRQTDVPAIESGPGTEPLELNVDAAYDGDPWPEDGPSVVAHQTSGEQWTVDSEHSWPPPAGQPMPSSQPHQSAQSATPTDPPDFVVEEGNGVSGTDPLWLLANEIGTAILESETLTTLDWSPRALDEIMAELRHRRVVVGQPAIVKRLGSLLHLRTGQGLKAELWLHQVSDYPDTAVVLRRDNRPDQDGTDGHWPAVLLAVQQTKAPHIAAFDEAGNNGDHAPSKALLEVLQESYLGTAKVADPSFATDLLRDLGTGAQIEAPTSLLRVHNQSQSDPTAPDYFLPDEEPGGAYVPLNDRQNSTRGTTPLEP